MYQLEIYLKRLKLAIVPQGNVDKFFQPRCLMLRAWLGSAKNEERFRALTCANRVTVAPGKQHSGNNRVHVIAVGN